MKRNEFLKFCLSCSSVDLLTLNSCSQDPINPKPPVNFTIDLSEPAFNSLQTVGSVQLVNGVFIVRAADGFHAISQVCTHAGCKVDFNSQAGQFNCPCHGGIFSRSGNVVSGPPTQPLATYQVNLSGNKLTVSS